MNKNRVTARRVQWTTEALNFFLVLHKDIEELQISGTEREDGLAKDTLQDAGIIYEEIIKELGSSPLEIEVNRRYSRFYFLKQPDVENSISVPMSHELEHAYNNVTEMYVKHQNMWDNAEEVNLESDFSDSDRSDNEEDATIFGDL